MKINPCRHRDHPVEVPEPGGHWTDGLVDWLLDPDAGQLWKLVGQAVLVVGAVGLAIWGLSWVLK